jgi:hypothetical protein
MKPAVPALILAIACYLSTPGLALARGSGGGHGSGGHGGGGHASGGARASSQGGGRASGGGGQARGTAAPRTATATTGTAAAQPAAPASSTARPRNGQPVIGTAVPRSNNVIVQPGFVVGSSGYAPYRIWPFYGAGLGFGGLGLYYDPFWSGYGYGGYGYGAYSYYPGYGYGYPYQNYLPGDGSGSSYGAAPPSGSSANPDSVSVQPSEAGHLRLRIEPPTAQVYVDGFYMGTVDDFNGSVQDVTLEAGAHRIEIRAPGFETLTFDVKTEANRTITYRGSLQPARQ